MKTASPAHCRGGRMAASESAPASLAAPGAWPTPTKEVRHVDHITAETIASLDDRKEVKR